MAYKDITVEWGENIPDRDKYLGEHIVSIVSISAAFGLLDLAFHDLKEKVHNIAEGDPIWAFLNDIRENGKVTKENNVFKVTIVETDDRFFDDGPNHCGLRCDKMDWCKPIAFEWLKSKFKRLFG